MRGVVGGVRCRGGRPPPGARAARLAIRGAPLAVIEPPFGLVELVEAAYWHPSRSDDPAVRWLLRAMKEAAREL